MFDLTEIFVGIVALVIGAIILYFAPSFSTERAVNLALRIVGIVLLAIGVIIIIAGIIGISVTG